MAVQIYNSLTKKKEELIPFKKDAINMYTCGVTVYDKCHIGHARSLYVFDVIRKYLEYRNFKVNFIRNITDIDDKIISKANELNKNWKEVVDENIKDYHSDLEKLGIPEGSEPRATENIPAMIKHIGGLIDKGYAYEADGDVYFSVRKFKNYGKLSGQSIEEMLEAVRIQKDDKKKDPLDFALWKKSKEGEPSWESPWGEGRPGWHIECSVMSLEQLKCDTLDIHGGGRDLIFPHHENEIAQTEALTGKTFAKYWIHHGLLTINAQKMAKSLGNFITIEDAVKKYDADDLKLFFLSSHYASPIDFTDQKIEEAHRSLERVKILLRKQTSIVRKTGITSIVKDVDFIEENKNNFLAAMDDDFNTPRALGSLFELVNETNKFIDSNSNDEDYVNIVFTAANTIEEIFKDIFGLFQDLYEEPMSDEEKMLLKERETARINKDFKRSDEIRELLRQKGIIVEDTKDGQIPRRL